METRISLVTLGVADLARSSAFYESLGWTRKVLEAEGVRFFQAGCMALGLYPRGLLAEDAGVEETGVDGAAPGFSGVTLAQNVRNKEAVARVLAEAEAAGAEIVKPAQDVFWGGHHGYFRDPDGHLWEIAWNPGFALDAAGALTLPD